jgi:hypothetical protein
VAEQAGVGQFAPQAEVEEEAEGPVVVGVFDDGAVGEVVVVWEELALEPQDRLRGGAAVVGVVGGGPEGPAALAVKDPQDAAQVMVGGNGGVKDQLVEFGRGRIRGGLQHRSSGPGTGT